MEWKFPILTVGKIWKFPFFAIQYFVFLQRYNRDLLYYESFY